MLGFAESEHPWLTVTMQLFSKNSNLCDHDTSTSRTDGQTDDLPYRNRRNRLKAMLSNKQSWRRRSVNTVSLHHSFTTLNTSNRTPSTNSPT